MKPSIPAIALISLFIVSSASVAAAHGVGRSAHDAMSAMSMPLPAARRAWVPLLRIGDPIPDASFVDQFGRTLSWRRLRGSVLVVSFIYTRCRDARMCSLVSAKFAELQRRLPSGTRLMEFTLDPAYDTPSRMRKYGELFGADPKRWILAGGDPERMRQIAARFGVGVTAVAGTTLVHTEGVGLVSRDGRVVSIVYGNDWQPNQIEAVVAAQLGLASNPWDRVTFVLRQTLRACGLTDPAGERVAWIAPLLGMLPLVAIALAFALDRRNRRRSA